MTDQTGVQILWISSATLGLGIGVSFTRVNWNYEYFTYHVELSIYDTGTKLCLSLQQHLDMTERIYLNPDEEK